MQDWSHHSPFRIAGPPRRVPALLHLRLLLGGPLAQFGWFFFGFGMIFVWVVGTNADYTSWYRFWGEPPTVSGTITGSEKTHASEGGSDNRPGTPIYGNHYRYEVDGHSYKGTSYAKGRQLSGGQRVKIEYLAHRPDISRIEGMRRALFAPWVAFVFIFPLIGLACIVPSLIQGRRQAQLLVHGHQAVGTFESKQATSTQINKQRVYKLSFRFTTDTGQTHEATAKTHLPHLLEDDAAEPLLYDPARPDRATLLDHLPGNPRIDEQGAIHSSQPWRTLASCIVPVATLVGHGWWIWYRYL